ncbi:MurR/RpiR family transcriptional regulator [Enemella evansiae]|uniref:RpiR family transcriptional regulator n=1 Tax=Enemella evansiae TaxID=2016499 RepID=A0A255GPK7_9ACTN|nr:MurR/RpiR family transcriptional regulator [Enemella evansiae]PFG68830.1 RpiR family transcriptional regulator [Propionibacteriaceae bacterium ES.041]OYN97046.1 RpiR family transcriptional regulator [Enemella evansiae]OYO00520.1 RpiR family transcriptional regulator [Enemella evansiae]OYO06111.1 RpiR family transcriptional regulator [Enemella evansiae]OYO13846.1 RpiR family transcriptional regulator [Enemella evansiae]
MNGPLVTVGMRARLPSLHPALREVAEQILADPPAAAARTISELATAAGTSQSTVVRLAHELGYSGYRELRQALASEVAVREFDRPEPEGDIAAGDDLASVMRKIAAADVQAVKDTVATVSVPVVEAVVTAMNSARRIDLYGVGASGVVAGDLLQKLHRIGVLAMAFTDSHLGLTSAALLEPGDVAIAFTHSGSTVDTVDCLALAARRGATTVAVTNVPRSPVTEVAQHNLLTAARETTFRAGATASRLAQLTIVDCLFVALAQRRFDATQQALQATADAVAERRRIRR